MSVNNLHESVTPIIPPQSHEFQFRLCCWNTLAASYCHSSQNSLYSYCEPDYLSLNHRIPLIHHAIQEFDIILLQEVDYYHTNLEEFLLKNGFHSIFVRRGAKLNPKYNQKQNNNQNNTTTNNNNNTNNDNDSEFNQNFNNLSIHQSNIDTNLNSNSNEFQNSNTNTKINTNDSDQQQQQPQQQQNNKNNNQNSNKKSILNESRILYDKHDGLVIAWRKSKFSPISQPFIVDFNDFGYQTNYNTATATATSASATGTENKNNNNNTIHNNSKYLRHNIGVFIYLIPLIPDNNLSNNNPIESPIPILVSNTHLYWNPLYEMLKFRQIYYFIHRIQQSLLYFNQINNNNNDNHQNQQNLFHQLYLSNSNRRFHYPYSSTFKSNELYKFLFSSIKSPIKQIPIFLCGDFNSTPPSITYSFCSTGIYNPNHIINNNNNYISTDNSTDIHTLTTDSSTAGGIQNSLNFDSEFPTAHSTRRFIVDSDLYKIAKLLRAVGNDVTHYTESERLKYGIQGLFDRCRNENRILITKSRLLIQRRQCPESAYLIKSSASYSNDQLDKIFIAIVLHFGLTFDRTKFYSRCTLCNDSVIELDLAEMQRNPPKDFPKGLWSGVDEENRQLTFFRCSNTESCNQLYWFGSSSEQSEKHFIQLFNKLDQERNSSIQNQNQNNNNNNNDGKELDELELENKENSISLSENNNNGNNGNNNSNDIDEFDPTDGFISPNLFNSNTIISHPFQFSSAYGNGNGGSISREPEFTNFTESFQDCLDYIFYTKKSQIHNSNDSNHNHNVDNNTQSDNNNNTESANTTNEIISDQLTEFDLRVLELTPLLSREEIEKNCACPNQYWPSDHLLLGTKFQLNINEMK